MKNLHGGDVEDGRLSIALISVHGLIRGTGLELGRDADTGGQVQYVLDLARALSEHPDVGRVELMTRQILSTNVSHEYGEHLERIAERAWIVRIPFGPHRYLRKESLWPYLPQFVDGAMLHFRATGRVPDLFHGHYPDAGVVASRLGRLMNVPVTYTGHSLGRVKKQRLMEKGLSEEAIEERYNISRRIQAEESVLESAALIVSSTRQEMVEQYGLYQTRVRKRTVVIPPGVNLDRFRPPARGEKSEFESEIDRFLNHPKKPMILAIQRPDERKNLANLIRAYGDSDELRNLANLVLLIGTRDDIRKLGKAQRSVLKEMLYLIDHHDLYGSVAYPKRHAPEDVAGIYRLATRRRGVFVNPAVTEPFGLTLIEAAASGLPIVATRNGGPREIVELCKNGVLVDPLDPGAIARGLLDVLSDSLGWRRRSRAGISGADAHFSWHGHVNQYMKSVRKLTRRRSRGAETPRPMVLKDRLLVCDIDNTLTGDRKSLEKFSRWLDEQRDEVAFGVATGRVITSALEAIDEWNIPAPDVLITAVGSEIHYDSDRRIEDLGWRHRIDYEWEPLKIRACLEDVAGLQVQPKKDQRAFKISYFVDSKQWPGTAWLRRHFKALDLSVSIVFSHGRFLDILPSRASKGAALRYVAQRWGFSQDCVLAAGDSGNDAAMLKAAATSVVVSNYSPELRTLRGRKGIYFSDAPHAEGILEGMDELDFVEGLPDPTETPSSHVEGEPP